MEGPARSFLRAAFRRYYVQKVSRVEVPPEIHQREFGVLTFDDAMVRHLSCRDEGELRSLLLREAPKSAYCSVSYYELPSGQMEEKGWLRSDLVFDIDSDTLDLPCRAEHELHVCRACGATFRRPGQACSSCGGTNVEPVGWTCERCLEGAMVEVMKLTDFLEKDFGVLSGNVVVYFSGNAGYHVHVVGSQYDLLNQGGRAEMVDYMSGKGLLPKHIGLSTRWSDAPPSPDEPGWRGRAGRYASELYRLPPKEAFARASGGPKAFLDGMVAKLGARVDAGVTIDIHRILRMAGTLHNKSGLAKKRVDMAESPFETAVGLDEEPARVEVLFSPGFTLKGQSFGPFKKEAVTLPTYAAAYLVAKGLAAPQSG
ncbi:MAG: hypothetical protein JRN39_01740 [Nitrososphaerota archaeon]|nr:hypothetical protein [Nitrososphaerota archaeon]